jgi:CDP-diacylglycerol---serine O-phosphatidyltransferase
MKIRLFTVANVLTLLNAFCGCCAIAMAMSGYYMEASYFIFASLFADFLDGFAARAMNESGPLGKQLDSLADTISFGLFPAVIMYQLLGRAYEAHSGPDGNYYILDQLSPSAILMRAPAFIIALFAILRLAKFNIDERQGEEFRGLATPAAAIFIMGIMHTVVFMRFPALAFLGSLPALISIIVIISILMIVDIPMFSFKFKQWAWKGNELRYLFIIACVALLILLRFEALAPIIALYIIISISRFIFTKSSPQ